MKFAFLQEPPFCFRNETGGVLGCDVELAQMICAELGVGDFQAVETEFAELLPGLVAGRWTMTTGLFVSAERQQTVDFTRPIWSLGDGLLVRRGNPLKLSGYLSVARSGARLGVIIDQIQHRTALEHGVPPERIVLYATQAEAAEAVASHEVDAYASVAMAHRGYLASRPGVALEVTDVSVAEKQPAFGAFALAKSSSDLRNRIDEVLGKILGSERHRTMMGRYGFSDQEIERVL